MSATERTNGHTHGSGPGFDGTLAPPQNLEAEQSVLGAVLLSDTALPALIIDERLQPEDFYREGHGRIYRAMLDLHALGEPVDALTLVEHLKRTGQLDAVGGRSAVDLLAGAVPAVGNVRQYARIVRENAMLRRLLRTAYDIQAKVHSHEATPRDLVDMAERAILEVAHEDSRKDFRNIQDLLMAELDKLEKLSQEGRSITGTPSGFDDLDNITGGFQPGNLIVLAARPSMGKCLVGSTLVHDPRTGARRRLDDVVAAVERGEEATVAALGSDFKLRTARATAARRSGAQPVFRMRTRLGRVLEATANHPLLTIGGWRELRDLRPGDRIAVPRRLPRVSAYEPMLDHELVLLAALVADGNLTQSTPRFCFGESSAVLPEVERAASAMAVRVGPAVGGTATISGGRGSGPNPVTALCRRHGLWGLGSRDKFVPEAVFALDDAQIARFLAVLYACDGHVYHSDRFCQIGYTTISERLARDVQHLLLRLGVVASIRTLRRAVYEGTHAVAREVRITGREGLNAFAATVTETLRGHAPKPNVDTLPTEAWALVLAAKGARRWADVSADAGHPRNHNWHAGTRGISRAQLGVLATATGSEQLTNLARSDVWWDAIESIEPIGEQETYDLEVPGLHNFVADDIVVHNSALMANFAEHAALEGDRAVALFSLEMSEGELAQRFIASQASIKGDDLRKGKVAPSRWPKILQASNRLAQSPLYIDDSSDLSVLDVRAKARRLAQQHADGLGLILIDYLQLMRSHTAVENRVEAIGHISRGLKTLARELDVPVIALSQLNRGVEQRQDKHPILSDLRESGCLAGETRVYLPDAGEYRRIDALEGTRDFRVLALNTESWKLEPCRVSRAFATGRKPVHALTTSLGRRLRATGNHKFLTIDGWRRLDELRPGQHIASPRALSGPTDQTLSDDELALLGHLIGDGCTPARHAIEYTTREPEPAGLVADLANGGTDLRRFMADVRAVGVRAPATNRDVLARHVNVGGSYCGSAPYQAAVGRDGAARVAEIVGSERLRRLASSDVHWDRIASIEPDGESEVFDLTVDGLHNFVAEDTIVHNSIEQDADLVMFVYRDEYYDKDSEREGIAELIISKHRNGGLGTVELTFQKDYPRFMSYVGEDRY